ncbi:MAG: hypothetical protein EOO47_28755, partial [Flavobacterium sp.]
MELDFQTKQQLANLLAKPSLVTQEHAGMLQNLVNKYPYYQPLHLLLAKASFSNETPNTELATAALYNNGSLLHQVIHAPESLVQKPYQIISYGAIKADELTIAEKPNEVSLIDEQEVFEEINEIGSVQTSKVNLTDEQEIFDEIIELNAAAYIPT